MFKNALQLSKMPKDKKEIFYAIEKLYSFVRNVFLDDAKIELPDDIKRQRLMTFRIDNDDGMPIDFVSRLKIFLSKFC